MESWCLKGEGVLQVVRNADREAGFSPKDSWVCEKPSSRESSAREHGGGVSGVSGMFEQKSRA